MAGFFGFFDYTKPGPGVPKNAPPKSRPRLFFEVLGRKFWNIIKINLLYTLFNIPGLALLFFGTWFMFPNIMFDNPEIDFYLRLMLGAFFVCFPILCFGPAQAGMTYCLRNYAREEHAFIWSDFKEHGLKNIKESLLICLIDFAAFILLCIAVNFYGQLMGDQKIWAYFTFGVIMLAFLLFAAMHLYIYPMLVTFHINVRQIYKNALIFATIRFLPNVGILLLCAAIVIATFIITQIGVILFVFITTAFIGLVINFYSYPTIKKYMIDQVQNEGGGVGEEAVGAIAEDGGMVTDGGDAGAGADGGDAGAAGGGMGEDGGGTESGHIPEPAPVPAFGAGISTAAGKVFIDGKFIDSPADP